MYTMTVNSLPSDKTLESYKLKAFADDKMNVAEMMTYMYLGVRVENIVGIGENAGNQHFLLSLHCF